MKWKMRNVKIYFTIRDSGRQVIINVTKVVKSVKRIVGSGVIKIDILLPPRI